MNQQCLTYKFECDLCDAGYVGFTRRHLHQHVEEQKSSSSSIGKHFRDKHSLAPKDLTKNFNVLKNLTVLSMRCSLFTKWDLLWMYNLTQFALKNLFTSFSLHVFIVRLHAQKFLYFLRAYVYLFLFFHFIIHLIMTEARSKRRVLQLVFIVKCFRNLYKNKSLFPRIT